MKPLKSGVFSVSDLHLGNTVEKIVVGGRDKFQLLRNGLKGVNQFGVIGYGSQGPAHAQNLRDSLVGTGIKVVVGLREGSDSFAKARAAGFSEEDGTLGEMYKVISNSDMAAILISDASQVENFEKISAAVKPGATLGFSHGFILGHLESIKREDLLLGQHYNVVGACPKGMGPSVRRLYEQGIGINGAGINCSIAVERDLDGQAADKAIAWAVAIGAPYIFQTTLHKEYLSDIFGERGVLLGGVHGMLEALYRHGVMEMCMDERDAFLATVENVTGDLSSVISKHGIIGVYNPLDYEDKKVFERAYSAAHRPFYVLLREIYDEVASGNEIRGVVMAGKRLREFGWSKIDGTSMWRVGADVQDDRTNNKQRAMTSTFESEKLRVVTAGIYCAMMMAQIQVLSENSHCLSEICNETVIEAVDSLNPYMHARGVAYMVDNCSVTARLGARKWAPRFDHVTMQQVLPALDNAQSADESLIEAFKKHEIHGALAQCAVMRPPVDISVA